MEKTKSILGAEKLEQIQQGIGTSRPRIAGSKCKISKKNCKNDFLFYFTSFLAWTFLNFCAFETAIANSTSIQESLKDIFVEWQYTHPFHEKYVHVQYNNLKCNKQDNNYNNSNVIWTIVIRWTNKIISSIEYIGSTTMLN